MEARGRGRGEEGLKNKRESIEKENEEDSKADMNKKYS